MPSVVGIEQWLLWLAETPRRRQWAANMARGERIQAIHRTRCQTYGRPRIWAISVPLLLSNDLPDIFSLH